MRSFGFTNQQILRYYEGVNVERFIECKDMLLCAWQPDSNDVLVFPRLVGNRALGVDHPGERLFKYLDTVDTPIVFETNLYADIPDNNIRMAYNLIEVHTTEDAYSAALPSKRRYDLGRVIDSMGDRPIWTRVMHDSDREFPTEDELLHYLGTNSVVPLQKNGCVPHVRMLFAPKSPHQLLRMRYLDTNEIMAYVVVTIVPELGVLHNVAPIPLQPNTTKQITLQLIRWARDKGLKYFDLENIATVPETYYKKCFFTGSTETGAFGNRAFVDHVNANLARYPWVTQLSYYGEQP